mgnify:CR=1 FL=1
MTPETLRDLIFPAAFSLLPPKLDTVEARAMLIAIALQESRLVHRAQLVGGAAEWWHSLDPPAHGYYQFEVASIRLMLQHSIARPLLIPALSALDYPVDAPGLIHESVRDNDILATVLARALLYTVPESLPDESERERGWNQYIFGWRPGKPRPGAWQTNWRIAWETVKR